MIAYALAFFAGVSVAVQIALNNTLTSYVSRGWVILISHLGGVLVMVALLIPYGSTSTNSAAIVSGLKSAPWYTFMGGLCGVLIVGSVLFSMKTLPLATVLSMVVAGEMFMSIVIDHFSIAGSQGVEISMGRLTGGVLICAGTYLLKQ